MVTKLRKLQQKKKTQSDEKNLARLQEKEVAATIVAVVTNEQRKEKDRQRKRKDRERNPQLNRDSVKRTRQTKPLPNRNYVKRARLANPHLNRERVRLARLANPQPNRDWVKNARHANPQPNRDLVKRSRLANPQAKRDQVKRARLANPQPHRNWAKKAYQTNPQLARNRVHKARAVKFRQKMYLSIHKKYNALRRKHALQFTGSFGVITTKLGNKLKGDSKTNRHLEATRIIKWCMLKRSSIVKTYKHECLLLKKKAEVAWSKSQECLTVEDKISALCGSPLHTESTEPFYYEYTYKVYNKNTFSKPMPDVIAINSEGQAVNIFSEYSSTKKIMTWKCSSYICMLNTNIVHTTMSGILQRIANLSVELLMPFLQKFDICSKGTQFARQEKHGHSIDCHTAINNCTSKFLFWRSIAPHFPQVRYLVQLFYNIRAAYNALRRIDKALHEIDVEYLLEQANKLEKETKAYYQLTWEMELSENKIETKYKNAFKALTKRLLDSPIKDCVSCHKLCYRRDVSNLQNLKKPITSDTWNSVQTYLLNEVDHSNFICHYCLSKFRQNQLPPTCSLNSLQVETRPSEILALNDFERILIQRAKAFQVVTRMVPVGKKCLPNKQLVQKVHGRTFHLPLPMAKTLETLPSPEQPLNPEHQIFVMVRGLPTKSKIVWESLVDINKVYAALILLKRINPLYQAIQLPEDAKHLLSELNQDLEFEVELSDQLEENFEKKDKEGPGLLMPINQEEAEDMYQHLTIYPLHEARDNISGTALYQMLKVTERPIDSRDELLDVKCFPDLYPEGINGQFQRRYVYLKSADYIKTRLMSKHSQFRLNQQYLFFLLNDANMRQLSAGIFQKLNVVNKHKQMSAATCIDEMNKDKLEGDLTTIFGRLRNTEQFWKHPRSDINCMTLNYGPATWFLTLSPCEKEWDDLLQYLRFVNGPSAITKSVYELVAMDPVSTSRFIDNKFHAMLDFITSSDEPIGKVKHYFWRREYQGRGMQHFHMLIWIENSPILGTSSNEDVATFIQKYVTSTLPKATLCPVLYPRVARYQCHTHNTYCMRNKKTKNGFKKVCRFSFPRPVSNHLVLRDIVVSIAGRKALKHNTRLYDLPRTADEVNINDYNPATLLAWPGNMDIQFVGEKTAILNWYITKYTTKSEKGYVQQTFEDINSTKSLCSRLYSVGLRSMNHRECGALEASDTLLGIPLYGTDSQTTIKWLDVNMIRSRRLKPRKQVLTLPPESTDIFFPSWVDNYYPQRPEEMETMHLFDFVRWFDITHTKPKSANISIHELAENVFLKKRLRPHLINHYKYDAHQQPEKYFYAVLLMFQHWRDTDELKNGFDTYTEAFNAAQNQLLDAVNYHAKLTETQQQKDQVSNLIDAKIAEFSTESDITTPQVADNLIPYEPNSANHAMHEFRDITSVDANEETNVDDNEETNVENLVADLNDDQTRVFNNITTSIQDNGSNATVLRLFVSGTGGTGKSFLIKTLKTWIKTRLHKDVAVMAPTGIAAFNVGGLTIHKVLQLPVEHGQTPPYSQLSDQTLKVLRSELKNVILIIIDEISMVSNVTFTYIHLRLSEIFATQNIENSWFGQKHILLLGDLLQLPPVHEPSPFIKLTRKQTLKYLGSLSVINLWTELFSYDELTINMRQQEDKLFAEILLRIRVGIITETDIKLLRKKLIPFISNTVEGKLKEVCSYIQTLPTSSLCLLPTLHMCKVLNNNMLTTIKSENIVLVAKDSVDCPRYLQKKVNKLLTKNEDDSSRTAGLEKEITIKIGCKVMLRWNIDAKIGLVNGALGFVVSAKQDLQTNEVKSISINFHAGLPHNLLYDIKPVTTKFMVMERAFIHRTQFPIIRADSITIHKSQSLSLPAAIEDIGTATFTCGQAYVALSRVKTFDGLHLINFDPASIKAQESAILEYNRLRSLYKPDLPILATTPQNRKSKSNDRVWTTKRETDQIQHSDGIQTNEITFKTENIKGFPNEDGVSCYANAVIQCLLHVPPIAQQIIASMTKNALVDLITAYTSGRENLNTTAVRAHVGGIFMQPAQQDASEFLIQLLHTSPPIAETIKHAQSITIHCNSCQYSTTNEETQHILQLHMCPAPPGRHTTLTDMMEAETSWEQLRDYKCNQCQGTNTQRKMRLVSGSQVLVIQFLVFNNLGKNNNFKITGIPQSTVQIDNNTYEPAAAVFHHGNTTESGHYTSYFKQKKTWMCANDTNVDKSAWPKLAKDLYLLFLQKK